MPNYGLTEKDTQDIRTCLAKLPAISQALLYGSRAMATQRPGSDIDLTLIGENLSLKHTLYPLETALEELNLPYTFDLSIHSQIDNKSLLDHIKRKGVVFYEQQSQKKQKNSNSEADQIIQGSGKQKGWEIKSLTSVCKNLDSQRVPITKANREPGEIPYYGASGIVDYIKDYLFDDDLLLVSEDGANLLARTYPIAFSVSGKTWINNHAHVLKFESQTTLDFTEYYLNSIKLDDFISGMAQPKLNQKKLNSIPIPVPPLAEQEAIVEVLDKAFAAIGQAKANIEQNIANAKELFQSKLNQIFSQKGEGWVERPLSEVSKITNGYSFKSGDFSEQQGTKSIKITNVGVQEFVEDNTNFLPDSFSEKHSGVSVKSGDLVIALTRTIISSGLKIAMIPDSYHGALLNQRVASIAPVEKIIDSAYLYYYCSSDLVSKFVLDNVNTLMQPNLSIKDLKRMPIPVCSTEQQNEIKIIIEKTDSDTSSLLKLYQTKLTSLDELKKSILQKAFAGELT